MKSSVAIQPKSVPTGYEEVVQPVTCLRWRPNKADQQSKNILIAGSMS